jgi:multidrug efflux pump subunit AcrA (membrane-fusion protein)
MKTNLSFVLCFLLFITSCTTQVWYQPGKTQAQIQKDWAQSQLASRRAALGIHQPVIFTDDGFAAGLAIAAQRDAARAARDIGTLTMQAKGYQLVPLSSVPNHEPYLKP